MTNNNGNGTDLAKKLTDAHDEFMASVLNTIIKADQMDMVDSLKDHMPPMHKDDRTKVIKLLSGNGYSAREIARAIGVSLGTVGTAMTAP